MRRVSRRFPNGVTVWVERLSNNNKLYAAVRNGRRLGSYLVKRDKSSSSGELGTERFHKFYDWLRAARGA